MTENGSAEPRHDYFVTSDGTKLHYIEVGEGPPVILIHGAGSRAERWFLNGIAPALAKTNRVVAISMRGHGQSDQGPPEGRAKMHADVLEFMAANNIAKAHIGGYSMGGGVTARLMATSPDKFITASFGGSGIRETEEWQDRVPPDKEGTAPDEEAARASRAATAGDAATTTATAAPRAARPQAPRPPMEIDLSTIKFPVLAINGEYDKPLAKTHRLWRELDNFTNVVLPGKGHLSAIVEGFMPLSYIDHMVHFITTHNPR